MRPILLLTALLFSSTPLLAQMDLSLADSLYDNEEFTALVELGQPVSVKEPERLMYLKTLALRQLLRYDEAMKEAVALKEYYPENKTADIQQLAIASQLHRYGFVSDLALKMAKEKKQSAAIYVYGISAANKINQAYESYQLSRSFYDNHPNDARAVLSYAAALQSLKQYDSSLKIMLSFMENGVVNTSIREKIVKAFYLNGNYEEAAKWGEPMMAYTVDYPNATLYYLQSLYRLKRYDDVIKWVKTIADLQADNEQLLLIGARAARELKQFEIGTEWLQKGKKYLLPDMGLSVYHELAENEMAQGHYQEAIRVYDTARYIYQNPYTDYLSGLAAQHMGNIGLARKYLTAYRNHPLVQTDTSTQTQKLLEYIDHSLK